MRARLSCALAALVLVGCASDDRVSGGGGIEIPNGIDMAVLDSAGKPVVSARVRVIAGDDWASLVASGAIPVLDSATTDAQGRASVERCEGSCWIEVVAGAAGARIASDAGSSLTLALSARARVVGQIPAGMPLAARMRLAGTDLVVPVDVDGRFEFDGVVRGGYALVAEGVGGHGLLPAGGAVVGWAGTEKVGVALDTSALLLDDFSDGDVVWSLRDVFGASYWWYDASIAPASVFGISAMTQSVIDSAGSRWVAMRVDTAAGHVDWANFGLDLGKADRLLPTLARLRAVRMKIRGSGSWKLILSRDSSGVLADLQTDLAPTSDWNVVRIPVSAFGDVGSRAWRLRNFVFWTSAAGTLEIDDVALEGLSIEDWQRQ